MRKVLKSSKDTRSSLETLAEDNRESFQDSRIDFSKKYFTRSWISHWKVWQI